MKHFVLLAALALNNCSTDENDLKISAITDNGPLQNFLSHLKESSNPCKAQLHQKWKDQQIDAKSPVPEIIFNSVSDLISLCKINKADLTNEQQLDAAQNLIDAALLATRDLKFPSGDWEDRNSFIKAITQEIASDLPQESIQQFAIFVTETALKRLTDQAEELGENNLENNILAEELKNLLAGVSSKIPVEEVENLTKKVFSEVSKLGTDDASVPYIANLAMVGVLNGIVFLADDNISAAELVAAANKGALSVEFGDESVARDVFKSVLESGLSQASALAKGADDIQAVVDSILDGACAGIELIGVADCSAYADVIASALSEANLEGIEFTCPRDRGLYNPPEGSCAAIGISQAENLRECHEYTEGFWYDDSCHSDCAAGYTADDAARNCIENSNNNSGNIDAGGCADDEYAYNDACNSSPISCDSGSKANDAGIECVAVTLTNATEYECENVLTDHYWYEEDGKNCHNTEITCTSPEYKADASTCVEDTTNPTGSISLGSGNTLVLDQIPSIDVSGISDALELTYKISLFKADDTPLVSGYNVVPTDGIITFASEDGAAEPGDTDEDNEYVLEDGEDYYIELLVIDGAGNETTFTSSSFHVGILEAELLAGDASNTDNYGSQLAISGDGKTALVGSELDDDGGDNAGATYVYTYDGSSWSQQAKLLPDDTKSDIRFGGALSLSEDGKTALIGAHYNLGAAYIFRFSESSWTQEAKLLAGDANASNEYFGAAVSLSADGSRALVSEKFDSHAGSQSGAGYIFDFDGTNWVQHSKLIADDAATQDRFGWAASLSKDGNTAILGAYADDDDGTSSGSAYVYRFDGTDWTQQAKLVADDAASEDYFGYTVSLSEDGDTALIGGHGNDDGASNSGSAYVFRFDGSWSQEAKLLADVAVSDDAFGRSVSLSEDENTALIGSGSVAYIFKFADSTWTQDIKLTPETPVSQTILSADGSTAIIGKSQTWASITGSAYIFQGW